MTASPQTLSVNEVKKVADLADVKVIGYPDNPKWLHDSTPKFMKVSVGGTVHFFNLRVRACRLLRHRFLGSLPNRRDEDHMSDSQELSDAEVERFGGGASSMGIVVPMNSTKLHRCSS